MRSFSVSLVAVVLVFNSGQVKGEVAVWHLVDGGNGHAYEFVEELLLWHDAKSAAELRTPPGGFLAGHLVTFSGEDEFTFVVNHCPDEAVWIGFTDELIEGEWRWIDHTPGIRQDPNFLDNPIQTAWTNWRPGEPNNFPDPPKPGNEDYAEMSQGYTWNDGRIDGAPFYYYVEYEPVPEPSTLVLLGMGAVGLLVFAFRRRKRLLVSLVGVVLVNVGQVWAGIITWDFGGTMDNSDIFSGFVCFDTATPNALTPNPERSLYNFAITDLRVDIGGAEVFWKAGSNAVDVMNDPSFPNPAGDVIRFYTDANSFQIANVTDVDLFFVDAAGTLLESTQIPMTPPNLSLLTLDPTLYDWGDYFDLSSAAEFRLNQFTGELGRYHRSGTITSLSVVPEPSTVVLLGMGAIGLLAYAWNRKRAT